MDFCSVFNAEYAPESSNNFIISFWESSGW